MSCEFLISRGHNTECFNPYKYSIKRTFHLARIHKEMQRNHMMGPVMANHMSRICVANGDLKPFNDVVKQLSEEE